MKKLFAILLALAMLLPMGLTARAADVEKKPFYSVNWVAPPFECEYVWGTPFMNASTTETIKNINNGIFDARIREVSGSTIPEMAAGLKELFDTYPDGARYISLSCLQKAIHSWPEDICFFEQVPPRASAWFDEFLAEYKRIGGKLDGFNVDIEYLEFYSYYLTRNHYVKDPYVFDKIVKNPTYAEKIRPELEARGFKFYSPATPETPEIWGINVDSGSSACRSIWDTVMQNYMAEIINESCAPLWKHYPDAILSDYTSKDVKPWTKEVGDSGGAVGGGGNRITAGNTGNDSFFFVRPQNSFFKDGGDPKYPTIAGYAGTNFENTQFNRFMYETNLAKASWISSDSKSLCWDLAHPYYNEPHSYGPFSTETAYHLGLLCPEMFIGYVLQQDCKTNGTKDAEKYEKAIKIQDEWMAELTRVAGYADRKPVGVAIDWNSSYVLSGVYANGRNLWRISPNNDVISRDAFKTDAADPTFKVGDETITFPGGKIIEDSKISEVGSCGYWVETAADVVPVVTRKSDFYKYNAGYQETYEAYEIGTEYNYNNALPKTVWETKKQSGGDAKIVADPTNAANKVLSVKGTYTANNVKMPTKIYAGDTYAEHQAWEISFTLPSDLAADAELILLNVTNEKKNAKDDGFKIAGGKVYYGQDGTYVEMEGVTLTAGTKYTAVREFDFTNSEAPICTYTIYAADGSTVGQAKKVSVNTLVTPIYTISFSCKKVAGEAILLDDYRLYPTKVNTDFYTYNADTGMRNTDTNQPIAANVAYRFSWLNATNTEKSYTVMAAYYDGDNKVSEEVVKEIKMAPNTDFVDMGIVENKQEGKTLVLYLKDNNSADGDDVPADPGTENIPTETTPAPTGEPDPAPINTKLIIIIAAAAAVVIVAVVVVIVASKKKKTTPKTEETPEEKTEE